MLGIRTFFFSLLLLSSLLLRAQEAPLPSITDSLRVAFEEAPRFVARIHTRNAFVTGVPIRTYGGKIGLAYGKRVNVGVGVHWIEPGRTYKKKLAEDLEEDRELRMVYGSVYFEYSFLYRKHWQVTIPVSVGVGRSWEKRNPLPELQGFEKIQALNHGAVIMYEPGMIAEYQFLEYFGIGGGVGLRLMLLNNRRIDQQFTAPTWELRFRVKLGEIWNRVKSQAS